MSVYHANFHSKKRRELGFPNIVTFAAADDAAAAAIAAVFGAHTEARMTSLTKRLSSHNYATNHPEGTRITLKGLGITAGAAVWRVRVRNAKTTPEAVAAMDALLRGVAFAGTDITIAALSRAPRVPGTTENITVTSVSRIDKA